MAEKKEPKRKPGVCIPWEQKVEELPKISGDEQLVQKVWEDIDGLGYVYIWHCLLSF
ncbi:MAG: hypothetical protein ACYTEL_02310 [Planctomycetota bacterium]|jgi:hypothetical protein